MARSNNGEALIGMAQLALAMMPAEGRLRFARNVIGFFQDIERDALAALGGIEPSDSETVDVEGAER